MENSRRCDICDGNVRRASFAKHLRTIKHLENIKHQEMMIPNWLFPEPIVLRKIIILNH